MNPDLNAIVRALDRLVVAQQRSPWEYIGTIAVVLTLVVLIWYTIETYKLRKAAQVQTSETAKLFVEAQRQNETSLQLLKETQRQNETALQMLGETQVQSAASIRPSLQMVSSVRRTTLVTEEITYQVRNLGVGPAFNISIEAVRFPKAVYLFHNPDTLGTGESGDVLPVRSAEEQDRAKKVGWYDFFIEGDNNKPFNVVVRYQNAEGKAYFTHHVITFEDGPVTQLLESGPQK
jgi:hypothetical protein